MKRTPQLTATVTFLTPEQGGFLRPHGSGIKPHMKLDNELFTSCIVWGESEDQVFEPGIEYRVSLELIFWTEYRDHVRAGMPLQLNQGSQVVARGTIIAIAG
jgi:hypothetical protein